jgi:hypothetical protein
MELKPKRNIKLIFLKVQSMDNYFILSSKDGDKWAKVVPKMISVKLGTCIHIAWN